MSWVGREIDPIFFWTRVARRIMRDGVEVGASKSQNLLVLTLILDPRVQNHYTAAHLRAMLLQIVEGCLRQVGGTGPRVRTGVRTPHTRRMLGEEVGIGWWIRNLNFVNAKLGLRTPWAPRNKLMNPPALWIPQQ